MIAKKKTNIGKKFTSKNEKAKPTESALAMTRDITMIGKMKTNIGKKFTSKNEKAKPTESALAMTRDITMIAKNKKTNIGMTFTSKNAKAKPTESANSAKKTSADDIAKKATLKTAGPTKNRTTFTAANIPAFFPVYPDYRLSDIV